jgi:hypothetical protein
MGGYPVQVSTGTWSPSYSALQQTETELLNYSALQQTGTISASAILNDPATILAHANALNLTGTQVQRLKKTLNSGNQQAVQVLTKAQKKKLAAILGIVRKPGST